MIVDAHVHISSTKFTPFEFIQGIAKNMHAGMRAHRISPSLSSLTDILLQQHQDHEAKELLSEMEASGIDKSILLLPDFTYIFKSEYTIEEMANLHHEIILKNPGKFEVFMGVDPRWGNDGLNLFVKGVERYGFKGLKLYPPCGYSPSDKSLFPFYEYCSEKGLPVLIHTGPTSPALSFEMSSPFLVDSAALTFPNVNFILAHGGIVNVPETLQLCAFRPNVYLDISGFPSLGSKKNWNDHLFELFAKSINYKVIFGTDWPVFKAKDGQKSIIDYFKSAEGPLRSLKKTEAEMIMYRNIMSIIPA